MRSMRGVVVLALLAAVGALSATPVARLGLSRPSCALGSLALNAERPRRVSGPAMALPAASSAALALRGGLAARTPDQLFNLLFLSLSTLCAAVVVAARRSQGPADPDAPKASKEVRSLQLRFLLVFWMYKMADWLQGPYFWEVYASKVIGGAAVSSAAVAKFFLTGFSSTAIFGAVIGGMVDSLGRKRGSLAFALLYSLSALSTRANTLPLLYAGRVAGGLGTSLLFSAPEAWLVSEHQRSGFAPALLSETFTLAYFGDSLVAIAAGQLAGLAAAAGGPTAPFELSIFFLVAGAAMAALTWRENKGGAPPAAPEQDLDAVGAPPKPAAARTGNIVVQALGAVAADRRVALVGAVQALFEGAMYIFVLQWPPALKAALGDAVPYGKIFSCFMVACMIGSSTFGAAIRRFAPEDMMTALLALATASMAAATLSCGGALAPIIAAFFAFEACVGCYFPLIGTLRSKYLPDAYRGVIMNLFGIPLNLIVVGVFLSIGRLGLTGAFACSFTALATALVSMLGLRLAVRAERQPDV